MPLQVATASIVASSSVAATAKAHWAASGALASTATCVGTMHAYWAAHSSPVGGSSLNTQPPTVVHHFKPVAIPTTKVPVSRTMTPPFQPKSTLIQAPKTTVKQGTAVNVKR